MTNIQTTNAKGKIVTMPVTVLDAPSLLVCGLRFYDSHRVIGEKWIEKLPKNLEKKVGKQGITKNQPESINITLIVATQPEKSGMKKKKPEVFEIALGGDDVKKKLEYAKSMLGKELSAKDIFKPGEFIDVSAVTKGYGYTGPVKRFGIRIQTRKDQQMHRHVGSRGGVTPRHVDWRVPSAGQYGFFSRTETSKKIITIDEGKNVNPKKGFQGYGIIPETFILIQGSVPGPRKRLIRLRASIKQKKFEPVDVKSITK